MLQIGAHQGNVLFGLARRDITPPVGIYGRWWPRATWDRVTGVHRPLTATAVVIRDPAAVDASSESDEEIIVALDMCILYAGRAGDAPGRRPASDGRRRSAHVPLLAHPFRSAVRARSGGSARRRADRARTSTGSPWRWRRR